jgi:hypothetical protein
LAGGPIQGTGGLWQRTGDPAIFALATTEHGPRPPMIIDLCILAGPIDLTVFAVMKGRAERAMSNDARSA